MIKFTVFKRLKMEDICFEKNIKKEKKKCIVLSLMCRGGVWGDMVGLWVLLSLQHV